MASGRYEALIHTLDAGVIVVPVACPKLVPLIEGDDPFGEATVAAVREAAEPAQASRRRHGRPRLHPLSADPADLAARLRARCHARLLRRRDSTGGLGDPCPKTDRERHGPGRHVPVPDDRRSGFVPGDGKPVPPTSDRGRGAREPRGPRERGRVRHDGRRPDELRVLDALPDFLEQPHGCVLWSQGKTRVLCTATVEEDIPRWLRGKGRGWMTAEYALLPASTGDRTQRGVTRGRPDGRTVEIQRLIGRAMRAVCDFEALGERTLWLDCDVLQADGGTRCAAITGAYVAAYRALDRMGLSKALPGVGGGSLGRCRRRCGSPRPRLPGGLAGRHGHERRDDSRRPARRGAGDRGARAVHARRARRSCSTSQRSVSSSSAVAQRAAADAPRV